MRPLTGIAKNFPAVMHLRVYGMNANGQGLRHRPRVRAQPVMPLILAVDTTNEYGSLALVRAGPLLEEQLLEEQLLEESGAVRARQF